MRYDIRKNWLNSFELILTKPAVIMPFVIIAFFESLALELIYFSTRKPISLIANPIVRKFFGESFLHYPGNLMILPRLFYYAQIMIYIFLGVFLTAISINIFKNIKAALPVKPNAMIKNALKNYLSFFVYGVIIVFAIFLLQKIDTFIVSKLLQLISKFLPQISPRLTHTSYTLFLFLTNIIMQTLLILTIPLIVIEKSSFLKAAAKSVYLGIRNFFNLFSLMVVPFLIYLPITMLKTFSGELADKTFPEINLYITLAGIIITIFLDCFIILCASQFLLDKRQV